METNINMQLLAAKGFYANGLELSKKFHLSMRNECFEIAPVAAVNMSFAAELLLKVLYNLESQKSIKGHTLGKIFNSLSAKLQRKIEDLYMENKRNSKKEVHAIKLVFNANYFNEKLKEDENDIENLNLQSLFRIHSDGFERWRYIYEKKDCTYDYEFNFNLMNEFIKSLLSIINEDYKDNFQLEHPYVKE